MRTSSYNNVRPDNKWYYSLSSNFNSIHNLRINLILFMITDFNQAILYRMCVRSNLDLKRTHLNCKLHLYIKS